MNNVNVFIANDPKFESTNRNDQVKLGQTSTCKDEGKRRKGA